MPRTTTRRQPAVSLDQTWWDHGVYCEIRQVNGREQWLVGYVTGAAPTTADGVTPIVPTHDTRDAYAITYVWVGRLLDTGIVPLTLGLDMAGQPCDAAEMTARVTRLAEQAVAADLIRPAVGQGVSHA